MTNTSTPLTSFPASPQITSSTTRPTAKKEQASPAISVISCDNDQSFQSSGSPRLGGSSLENSFPPPTGFTVSYASNKVPKSGIQSSNSNKHSIRRSPKLERDDIPQTMTLKLDDSFVNSQGSDCDSASQGLSLTPSCNNGANGNPLAPILPFREDLNKQEQLKIVKQHFTDVRAAAVGSWRDDACFNTKIMKGCVLSDKMVKIAGTKVEMQLPIILDRPAFDQEVKDFRWRVKSLILTAHYHHKNCCPRRPSCSQSSSPSQSPRSSPSSRRSHRHKTHIEASRKDSSHEEDPATTTTTCREIVPGLCIADKKLATMLCRDIETIFSAHLTRHPNGIVVGAASALEAGLRQITDLRLFRSAAGGQGKDEKRKAAL